ncbi:unnamed protein product [Protopolystoma xenopodis]|uniref:Uncharacterized protein n=1 Tax=Protopolystoma xenopodis TaxID=117903 RepID=A0A448WTG9_9PLAT|nr:unnamed protein product [Protopolystoma xenopodis]
MEGRCLMLMSFGQMAESIGTEMHLPKLPAHRILKISEYGNVMLCRSVNIILRMETARSAELSSRLFKAAILSGNGRIS